MLLGGALFAEEDFVLAPTMVTATRSMSPIDEQPYAIYQHTLADIDGGVGRTVLDRINYGPGVLVQRTAPSQASPFIRGLTGEQTLLLFDGVRLSHAMMRPGPNQYAAMIPAHSLSSIDVILGSSSVVQGSDGLTGAMDFRLSPAGGTSESMSPWLKAKTDYANGSSVAIGFDSGYDSKGWLYSFDASFEDYHNRIGGKDAGTRLFNFNAGKNEIANTSYDQRSLGLRLAYQGVESHRFEINLGQVSQNDTPRPDGYFENTNKGSRSDGFRYFEEQTFNYLHLRDHWDLNKSWAQQLKTTFAWHQHIEDQHRRQRQDNDADGGATKRYRLREYDNKIDSKSLDLEFQSGFQNHAITWGTTYSREETKNSLFDTKGAYSATPAVADLLVAAPTNSTSTTVPDGSEYNSLGFYAQNDHHLGDGWSLLYGLRYSRSDWEYVNVNNGGNVESSSASDLTWNLRGQYFFSEGSRVFAGVSKAFRAPNLTNLSGFVDRGGSGVFAQGSSDLDPETSITTELGYSHTCEKIDFSATLFDTRIDDLIARDVDTTAGNVENVETAHLYGFELDASFGVYEMSSWKVGAFTTASYVRATMEIDLNGAGVIEDNISRANRFYGKSGFSLANENGFLGTFQARWHDAYDKVASWSGDSDSSDIRLTVAGDATGAMPGYAVFDLRMDWPYRNGKTRLGFGLENLFNKSYREPGSGADGAGRNLFVEASLKY